MHPARFSLEGRPIRKVRQSVTRLQKAGHSARVVRARELTLEQRREIERVSRSWLRGQPERGFSMALDDMHAPRPRRRRLRARLRRRAAARRLRALRARARERRSLALGDAPAAPHAQRPHGVPALRDVRRGPAPRGIERISLNFNAFGDLLRSDAKLPAWERGLRFVLAHADRYFQVERLLDFNRKFFPEWEPRYAAFERYSDLPLAALVLLSIESLVAWPDGAAAALAARLAGAHRAGRRPPDLAGRASGSVRRASYPEVDG